MATKYFVANPRNIPKDVRILHTSDGKDWFEGDEFTASIPKKDYKDLRDKGFLVEVSDG